MVVPDGIVMSTWPGLGGDCILQSPILIGLSVGLYNSMYSFPVSDKSPLYAGLTPTSLITILAVAKLAIQMIIRRRISLFIVISPCLDLLLPNTPFHGEWR